MREYLCRALDWLLLQILVLSAKWFFTYINAVTDKDGMITVIMFGKTATHLNTATREYVEQLDDEYDQRNKQDNRPDYRRNL